MENSVITETLVKIADSIDFNVTRDGDKKVLLKISNLKQYFPVRGKKNLFVKANDGISMDIYEGETFGLVGESGCGKSTLGRTILQLNKQTHGKTMYYGRALDELAPQYTITTAKNLNAEMNKLMQLYQISNALETKVNGMKSSVGTDENRVLYDAMEEFSAAKKLTDDAFLDLAQIIGGLLISPDLSLVSSAYLSLYTTLQERNKLASKLNKLESIRNEKGKRDTRSSTAVAEDYATRIASMDDQLEELQGDIEILRESVIGSYAYEKIDSFRDAGIDLARLTYNEMRLLRRDMQLVFQDPYSSLNPRMTVGQIIGEGLLAHDVFNRMGEKMQDFIIRIMETCGLASYMIHRYPHQFSGGQRQRIGIARALALKPRFVVCDEAVSALDVSIQSQILNLLSDLKAQENLTYLFISHDLSVIRYISDRIGVMYLGNLVELANVDDIFSSPRHPYTDALLKAIPTTDIGKPREQVILEGDIPSPITPPKGCKFHTRCQYTTEICKQVTPEFEEPAPGHYVACHNKLR